MNYLYLAVLVLLCACATPRNTSEMSTSNFLQDKDYRHHFQVEKIQKKSDSYLVTIRNYMAGKRYVSCDQLPDSVRVGSYVSIK